MGTGMGLAAFACRETFESFSGCHAVAVALCALISGVWIVAGVRARGTRRERVLRGWWSAGIILWQVWTITYWVLPGRYDLQKSLPLHICDLAPWAAAAALMWETKWARALLYFWGLGLCTQAFITPVVRVGWGTWEFWFFWVQHTQIVAAAAYEIIVRRYRPNRRALAVASSLSWLYVVAMVAFDVATGTNYGYVGANQPEAPTVIDKLGPWPLRVVWLCLIVQGVFVVLWLLGTRGGQGAKTRADGPPA